MLFLLGFVTCGTVVLSVGSSPSLKIYDTVVWTVGAAQSVVQVDQNCKPLTGGFDSGNRPAVSTFYHSFNVPGTFYYASTTKGCDLFSTVFVSQPPVNEYAISKLQMAKVAAVEDTTAKSSSATVFLSLSAWSLLLVLLL